MRKQDWGKIRWGLELYRDGLVRQRKGQAVMSEPTARRRRVPEHLIGTRAALFHVLLSAPATPAPPASADPGTGLPSAAAPDSLPTAPVFAKSERDRFSALLREDEFHFNY